MTVKFPEIQKSDFLPLGFAALSPGGSGRRVAPENPETGRSDSYEAGTEATVSAELTL